MLAALEASIAALSIANLLNLARAGLKFIFLAIGADLAASSGRVKCEVARRMHAHTDDGNGVGVVIMVDVRTHCTARSSQPFQLWS